MKVKKCPVWAVPRKKGRTRRHHTYKEHLNPFEGSSELSEHVGKAGWEVHAAALRMGVVALAGPRCSQEDQAI